MRRTAHCAPREMNRGRGGERGGVRRKRAARGARRVMSEGDSGRCEARRTARGAKWTFKRAGNEGGVRRKHAAHCARRVMCRVRGAVQRKRAARHEPWGFRGGARRAARRAARLHASRNERGGGAGNGGAVRRKGGARGARRVMSEGVRGRSEACAAHCVRRVMYRGRDGERGRRVSEAPNTVIQYKDRFGSLHAAEVKLGDALVSKGTPVS